MLANASAGTMCDSLLIFFGFLIVDHLCLFDVTVNHLPDHTRTPPRPLTPSHAQGHEGQ